MTRAGYTWSPNPDCFPDPSLFEVVHSCKFPFLTLAMSQRGYGGKGLASHGNGGFNRSRGSPRVKLVAAEYKSGPLIVVVNCFKVIQLPLREYWHYDGKMIVYTGEADKTWHRLINDTVGMHHFFLHTLHFCALTRISDIKPKLSNRARAIELVDNLQIGNPQVFPSRAIYDGRANLFSSKELNLSNGTFGSVRDFDPFLST